MLADLMEGYWTAGDPAVKAKLSTEIRLQSQRYGLAPIDRVRLRWNVVEPPPKAAAKKAPARRPAKPDPRLKVGVMAAQNPSLGAEVCAWIETYLVHGPGDVQETPIELDDEFRTFIYRAYEVYPKAHPWAGRRVYPRAFLSRPKGRAKSELAGMLCCVEALGPVRFDGWRGNKPIGAPVTSPIIKTLATEESQAGNTYDNALFMLQNGLAIRRISAASTSG